MGALSSDMVTQVKVICLISGVSAVKCTEQETSQIIGGLLEGYPCFLYGNGQQSHNKLRDSLLVLLPVAGLPVFNWPFDRFTYC